MMNFKVFQMETPALRVTWISIKFLFFFFFKSILTQ